jgi:aryl-phospho-beta-D-glucosidase BglC (GH1 family)
METTRLRGLNFGGWLSQIDAIREKDPANFPGIDRHMETFIDKNDFALQKTWGFNHVRLPIDAYLFFDAQCDPIEPRMKYLDNAVRFAGETGQLLVMDLHECPGHDFADATEVPVQKLFTHPEFLEKTEKIWACLAERFGEEPHVLFEALNEPVAPAAAVWNTIKDRLCKTIRAYAPKRTIIVGSNMWSWPSTYGEMTPVESDSIIYNFHFYEPLLFTHQGAPWMKEPEILERRTYPADYGKGFTRKYGFILSPGVWDRSRMMREISLVSEFGRRHKVPVVCNEFGVYAPVPMELQLHWLNDLLSVLREMDIGFSYWNYKNLDFGIISRGEKLHATLPQYDNPERINYEALKVLREG